MITKRISQLLIPSLILVLTGMVLLTSHVYAAPQTFIVLNTNDSGAGSLRQAILSANSNGNPSDQDSIIFDIDADATGDKIIEPQSPITITQSVLIDGFTQGDAIANTNQAPQPFNGTLRVAIYNTDAGGGFTITAPNVTLKGLNIADSENGNIVLEHADNFKLLGSYLDTLPMGQGKQKTDGYENSVVINSSDDVTIGGTAAADRNILGFCTASCIDASGTSGDPSNNLRILGNYIGVGADGVSNLYTDAKSTGIVLSEGATNATIGGTTVGAGNTIKSNTFGAVRAEDVTGLTVQANRIMFNAAAPNTCGGCNAGAAGIFLGGVTNSTIGSSNPAGKNILTGDYAKELTIDNSTITNNPSSNVLVIGNNFGVMDDNITAYPTPDYLITVMGDSDFVRIQQNNIKNAHNDIQADYLDGVSILENAQHVSVSQNSIYNNDNRGISIGGGAPTANDSSDGDTGPNGKLNYPTYFKVTESAGNTTVGYTYRGAAGNYRIEFFSNTLADSDGPGEGEEYLGSTNISYNGFGPQSFNYTLNGVDHDNITMTATEINQDSPNGYGATSEFGAEGPTPNDLAVSKRLLNPEDMTTGQVIQYEVTLTNKGPEPIDISYWDGSSHGSNDLLTDLMPPGVNFLSASTNTGVECITGGPGSVGAYFGSYFPNHTSYEIVLCGYVDGTRILSANDSVSVIISGTVIDDVPSTEANYVIGPLTEGDPDYPSVVSAFSSGNDVVDTLLANSSNNIAYATSFTSDMTLTKILDNPQDVANQATLNYTITLTNNGPFSADLSGADGSIPIQKDLLIDVLPNNLDFVSAEGDNVTCSMLAPANALPFFSSHPDYNVIHCFYSGAGELASGDSLVIRVVATVNGAVDNGFTNFAMLLPTVYGDPESYMTRHSLANAYLFGIDVVDDLVSSSLGQSITRAAYTVPSPETPGGSGSNGGNNGGLINALGKTGQQALPALLLVLLIGCSLWMMRRYLKRRIK